MVSLGGMKVAVHPENSGLGAIHYIKIPGDFIDLMD
jgi:hypothetical protein